MSQLPVSGPDSVRVTVKANGITIITINRPHRRNAVDHLTGKRLAEAFLSFENDPAQKVAVFHGDHGVFCAGSDLHEMAKRHKDGAHFDGPYFLADPVKGRNLGPMGPSRMQIRKPVISAVAGWAVAGGLELSLLGDMRVVEEDAIMGVYCRRWGIPLLDGGTVRLQAVVGLGRALDMILTGRGVGAKEAVKIAEELIRFPQLCVNVDRDNCYYSVYNARSFEDALAHEFENGIKVFDAESVTGAGRFSSGIGRHGSFAKL
ncbi:hypothetical protein CLAIMM_07433 isoform 1 [Cladophialophora immunda]|nr:hypothetical protein CLAIMM_07433 isoform 1 [Cladophialophora immunda]